MVPPPAMDGGKENLSGRQRRISGRGTPTRATGYRFGHLCGEGCSTGGAQRELGRRERALAGRRAKIFFARWNSGGLRGCLKKEFVKKDTRRTGNLTPYPSCPFLQSPRPYRCPDAARRRSLWRASPTTHPGTDRPASSGREPAAPKDPKPGDFSDPVSPRPVRTSVFLRHKSTPGIILTPEAKRQQRKRPPVFFAKKVFPRKSSLPQARTPRRCSGFNPGKTSVSRFSGNPRWYRAISATTSRQSVATATSPSISR